MIFENEEFGNITAIEKDGEPWFIAKEISDILEYSETSKMLRRIDDDDRLKWAGVDSIGKSNTYVIINESGFYNAVIGSKKPEAKRFKKWITSEVLPSIRKTGSYSVKAPQTTLEWMELCVANEKRRLIEETKRKLAENIIEAQKPKIDYVNGILASKQSIKLGEFAKAISNEKHNVGPVLIFRWMRLNKFIMYENNKPYQKYMDCGWLEYQEGSHMRNETEQFCHYTCFITPKGRVAIAQKIYDSGDFLRK